MKENQNIEWKESWHDEYIKWICGFANAQGGILYIGKNNKGRITGLSNVEKLLRDIPNKVKDLLGIIIDVNLKSEKDNEYLEIKVQPYPYPISFKGSYHYRSGSTKQELKGAALDKFLLQKQGKHWDGVPLPGVNISKLQNSAFAYFRKKTAKNKRLNDEVLKESNAFLIKNLHLLDGKYLKRAAVLLFYDNPERYITGAYIKIGFFKSDDDLLFQDEIHGNLFEQVEKSISLLLTKYIKANINYDVINRIEEYPFPEPALREALLNAIAHKDYSSGNPIQISVYNNKIIFWNEGQLPENWTVKDLIKKHPSKPFNPDIANTFFRAGLIESWGRGTLKIIKECKQANLPTPVFNYTQLGFSVKIYAGKLKSSGKTSGKTSGKILEYMRENTEITIPELAEKIGVTERSIERNIQNLRKKNKLERIHGAKGGYWKIKE